MTGGSIWLVPFVVVVADGVEGLVAGEPFDVPQPVIPIESATKAQLTNTIGRRFGLIVLMLTRRFLHRVGSNRRHNPFW